MHLQRLLHATVPELHIVGRRLAEAAEDDDGNKRGDHAGHHLVEAAAVLLSLIHIFALLSRNATSRPCARDGDAALPCRTPMVA